MRAPTLTYKEALAFLDLRIDYERALSVPYTEREFQLDRMRDLLSRLGNPHQRLKIIHVAGTKGKGSTSAFTDSVLRQVKPEWKVGEEIRLPPTSHTLKLPRHVDQGSTLHLTSSQYENVSGSTPYLCPKNNSLRSFSRYGID